MEETGTCSDSLECEYSTLVYEDKVVVPSHARHLLQNLNKMRGNRSLCDTELHCQGEVFHVHRAVLASGSEYFANLFDRWVADPNEKKVEMKSVNSGALSVIVEYLYKGVLHISNEKLFDVFVAADKLQVEGAVYVCLTRLLTQLEPQNCIFFLNMAVFYSLNALKVAAIELLCSEDLVPSTEELTEDTWIATKDWLQQNAEVINIPLTCTNILQIKPDAKAELFAIFDGYLDASTKSLLNMSVLPNATSILNAARANSANQTQKDNAPLAGDGNCSEDGNSSEVMKTSDSNSHSENRSIKADALNEVSLPASNDANHNNNIDDNLSEDTGVNGERQRKKYPNSRLWTMTPQSAGSSDDVNELYDEYFTATSRIAKKRKMNRSPAPCPRKSREVKMCLLGGCNSTMTTVRTIFRHIQPFNVVTGVTIARYNLSLDLSSRDSDWEQDGFLETLCHDRSAVAVGSKTYVLGGKDAESQYLSNFEVFDLKTKDSTLLQPAPHARSNATSVRIGNHIYVVGGRNTTLGSECQYAVDRYDISLDRWETVAKCSKIGYTGGAAAYNGLLYTFCGQRPIGKASDTVMVYEPHSNSWSPQPDAPVTMSSCHAATSNRQIFILTSGYKNLFLYQYTPSTRTWSKVNKHEPIGVGPQDFFIMSTAMVSYQGCLYVLLFIRDSDVRVLRLQKFHVKNQQWDVISTKPVPLQHCAVVMAVFNCRQQRTQDKDTTPSSIDNVEHKPSS